MTGARARLNRSRVFRSTKPPWLCCTSAHDVIANAHARPVDSHGTGGEHLLGPAGSAGCAAPRLACRGCRRLERNAFPIRRSAMARKFGFSQTKTLRPDTAQLGGERTKRRSEMYPGSPKAWILLPSSRFQKFKYIAGRANSLTNTSDLARTSRLRSSRISYSAILRCWRSG
jgi:hypothetical protein